jgi:ubiquinone biosynthesis protein
VLARIAGDVFRGVVLVVAATRLIGYVLWLSLRGRADARLIGGRLRSTFQDLGATYVKVGQFLAARFDLLPLETCNELALLFDRVPPMPGDVLRRTIESELGAPVDRDFQSFDWTPIAAASIAQVHRARLRDGTVVAVKVQRPGLAATLAADARWFRRLAWVADRVGLTGGFSASEAVDEFVSYTTREFDFIAEGRAADRRRRDALPGEVIPRIEWSLTTKRLLTMEYLDGISLARVIELYEAGALHRVHRTLPDFDIRGGLRLLTRACLSQVFVSGFFHADPHPGNIFFMAGHRVGLVDFGIFGEVSGHERTLLAAFIGRNVAGDIDGSFRGFAQLCQPTERTDLRAFERDAKHVLQSWHAALTDPATAPRDRLLGKYLGLMLTVLRRHRLKMEMNTLLVWRTVLTLDASAQRFAALFDLSAELGRFFAERQARALDGALALVCSREASLEWAALIEAVRLSEPLTGDIAAGRLRLRVADTERAGATARGVSHRAILAPLFFVTIAATVRVWYDIVSSMPPLLLFGVAAMAVAFVSGKVIFRDR